MPPLPRQPGEARVATVFSEAENNAMDVVMVPVLGLLINVVGLYTWIVVIGVILSWLVHFRVMNTSNRFVYLVGDFIYRITEPALRPIRNFLPNLGGIDISPVVLILLLLAIQDILGRLILKIA